MINLGRLLLELRYFPTLLSHSPSTIACRCQAMPSPDRYGLELRYFIRNKISITRVYIYYSIYIKIAIYKQHISQYLVKGTLHILPPNLTPICRELCSPYVITKASFELYS